MRHHDLQAFWLFIIFLLILVGGYLILKRGANEIRKDESTPVVANMELAKVPLFTDGLAKAGVSLDTLGYHAFSPDGKYFIFTGIKDSDAIPAKTYLVNLETGVAKLLPGIMVGDVSDARVIALSDKEDLILYNTETAGEARIKTQGNTYAGVLSPDGKTYVFDTQQGIRAYDINTGTLTTISNSQYDGASAWYADSQHMLGYHETGENLFEAGKGRTIGVWNIRTKEFSPLLEGKIKDKTIRNVTWIVPDSIARVNTGWDDGSHDYLVDIHEGTVVDLGETSSALMAGMKDDPMRGYFALVMGPVEADKPVTASLYKGLTKIASTELSGGYLREYVQIVDAKRLLYVRKQISATGSISTAELVLLDFTTGTEEVIKKMPQTFAILSLAPDHKTWVVSAGNQFFNGKLE